MVLAVRRYALAMVVSVGSLAAVVQSVRMQTGYASLMAVTATEQLVPLPAEVLPPGSPRPLTRPPLSQSLHADLNRLLSRRPQDPTLFNLFYADQVKRAQPIAVTDRQARTLARLGWRWTPAQQNLITRAILAEDFDQIVDRADALLRRHKLSALAFAVLTTMEAIPQVQGNVIARLRAQPRWRLDYLSVISPQSPQSLLAARVQTIAALLRSPASLSREELAPSIRVLTGGNYGRQALALWTRKAGGANTGNRIYDPAFRKAAQLSGTPDLQIPFEWRFGQDLGFSVQASSAGVTIDWDRRGAPLFMSQLVPVAGGRRLVLTVRAQTLGGTLPALLSPTMTCGALIIPFSLIDSRNGETQFNSDPLPAGCTMGVLGFNGTVDSGHGNATINISYLTLR